jgi:16S rRNA (cytidine1402-2'-O)-methyltransferase
MKAVRSDILGFPPPRHTAWRAAFGRLRVAERAGLAATPVWHEVPHRLAHVLVDMVEAFAQPVARELTKRFEEMRREDPPTLWLANHPRTS